MKVKATVKGREIHVMHSNGGSEIIMRSYLEEANSQLYCRDESDIQAMLQDYLGECAQQNVYVTLV